MKNIISFAIALLASLQIATASSNPSLCAPNKTVTLDAGSLVILETNESLFSDKITPGKMIHMRVRTNVYAEGEVVIRTGAQALGRVKSVDMTSFNTPGSVTIELFYVQTVDGQQAPLHGNEQTISAPLPNEETNVPINTLITSQTMNDMDVKVK